MPARVVIDRDCFLERQAILLEAAEAEGRLSAEVLIEIAQQASLCAYNTGFALAATALANGDEGPARELCRREAKLHGRQWALELRDAIKEAVNDSLT